MTNPPAAIFEPSYHNWVIPVQENFPRVTLSGSEITRLDEFVEQVTEKKKTESRYSRDPEKMAKRFTTGFGAEMALGKIIDMDILDWRVGQAACFDVGDLSTINLPRIGVKAIEYGPRDRKFPIVHARPGKSEVLFFKHREKHVYMLCGVYTPDVLEKYTDRSLIWDDNIPLNKTCFYGIPFGRTFSCYSELENINAKTEQWCIKNNRLS